MVTWCNVPVKIVDIKNFVNFKSVKAEKKELADYNKLKKKSVAMYKDAYTDYTKYWFSATKINRYITWPAILLSTYLLFKSKQIGPEQVVLSITVLTMLTDFIWELVDKISNAKKDFAKLQNGYNYLAGEENILLKAEEIKFNQALKPSFKNSLELSNLSFVYPDATDEKVLKNVNLIKLS